jgi:hypothetical protein
VSTYESIAAGAVLLIGPVIFLILMLDQYRKGRKKLAIFGAVAIVSFAVLAVADRGERTGRSVYAVALSCKPKGYKTTGSCTFERSDGLADSLPIPEWVRPGVKVVLVETKTPFTRRSSWHVAEIAQ